MKLFRVVGSILVIGATLQACDSSNSLEVTEVARPAGSRADSSVQLDVFNDIVAMAKMTPDLAAVDSTNLFINPGFESGKSGWTDCTPGASSLSTDASEGVSALRLSKNSCFYSSVETIPGSSYVLSCEVKLTNNMAWTGMGMVFTNTEYKPLVEAPVAVATSGEYTTLVTKGVAPEGSSFGSIWIHSDHGALVDNCSLTLESNQPPAIPSVDKNLLSNGDFTHLDSKGDVNHWTSGCGGTSIADGASLYLADGTCVDQALSIGAVESIKNNSASFSCFVADVARYSDFSIFLDDKLAAVHPLLPTDKNTRVTVNVDVKNISNGFVTLYSEGHLQVEDCLLSIGVVTTDPVVDPEPVDPVVDPEPADPVVDPEPVDPVVDPEPVDPVVDPDPVDPVVDPDPVDPVVDPEPVDPVVDPEPVDSISFQIGDIGPGGGTVFVLLNTEGTSGLEVSTADVGLHTYGCSGVDVDPDSATNADNGLNAPTGEQSSNLLRAVNTSEACFAAAADAAFSYSNNNFTDWYLPSTDELIQVREASLLSRTQPGVAYWSSTEDSAQNAFTVFTTDSNNSLDQGEPSTTNKNEAALVLPIRKF